MFIVVVMVVVMMVCFICVFLVYGVVMMEGNDGCLGFYCVFFYCEGEDEGDVSCSGVEGGKENMVLVIVGVMLIG